MKHFSNCPINRNYDVCTCDMAGEEIAVIEWAIQKLEGKQKWYHFFAKLTLAAFSPPEIKRINQHESL